jgi:hypothetical protein
MPTAKLIALLLMNAVLFAQQIPWPAELSKPVAELHIAHPGRLIEALGAFAGRGVGTTPATDTSVGTDGVASRIARYLYGCKALDGVDLLLPSRFYWLQDGQVVAMVPLSDRPAFVKDFIGLPFGSTNLIAIGERQGTLIYAYNGDEAIHEYRMLIRDNTAYLGSSVDECEILAKHPWPLATGDEPTLWYKQERPRPQWPRSWRLGTEGRWLPGVAQRIIDELYRDIDRLTVTFQPKREGYWVLGCDWQIADASVTARWLANQQNQASRLLPILVEAEPPAVSWYGSFNWSGSLVRLFDTVTADLGEVPDFLPEQWQEPVRNWFGKRDAQKFFAASLAYTVGREGIASWRLRSLQRHDDLEGANLAIERLARLARGVFASWQWALESDQGDQIHSEVPVQWLQLRIGDMIRWCAVRCQSRRHLVTVQGWDQQAVLLDAAVALSKKVATLRPPQGRTALTRVEVDAGKACVGLTGLLGLPIVDAAFSTVTADLRVTGRQGLEAVVQLHPAKVGAALRASGLDAYLKTWLGR